MTRKQIRALVECAEGLKDIINASDAGEPYTDEELKEAFSPLLGAAYESGVLLSNEE
jgi:hypothetical protein